MDRLTVLLSYAAAQENFHPESVTVMQEGRIAVPQPVLPVPEEI